MNLDLYRNYNITVDTATAPGNTYSSFSIQAHTQLYSTTLTNLSNYCQTASDPACAVTGSNVGLVQIWNEDTEKFPFRVRVECGQRTCSENSTVEVLLAVIGIPIEGCYNFVVKNFVFCLKYTFFCFKISKFTFFLKLTFFCFISDSSDTWRLYFDL